MDQSSLYPFFMEYFNSSDVKELGLSDPQVADVQAQFKMASEKIELVTQKLDAMKAIMTNATEVGIPTHTTVSVMGSLQEQLINTKLNVLFSLNEISEVFIGKNFITVTKKETALWEAIYNKIVEEISKHIESGDPTLTAPIPNESKLSGKDGKNAKSPIEEKIHEILDSQIRPAVASDGGDVIFDSYKDGVLKLHLQGACSSCPSSTMTLKHGIEQMLKREIPELKEVISV
jgi:Fe-S cluster biogenesis protein NfuA